MQGVLDDCLLVKGGAAVYIPLNDKQQVSGSFAG